MIRNVFSFVWQLFTCFQDKVLYKGADFGSFVRWRDLAWDKNHGNEYKPSIVSNLRRVLNQLPISSNDKVLDIGCGKGKVMYVLSLYPFSAVHGYDLSKELVEIANANFKLLHVGDKCLAFQADAMNYAKYDGYNYFYFFNSVPKDVFIVMIGNLEESLKRHPRKVFFLYMHPEQEEYILQNTSLRKLGEKKSWISFLVDWFDLTVYSNA